MQLRNLLLSNNLFFRISVSQRFRIFAPSTFQPGSSYSHLNEATYPRGNANSLMTLTIGFGETIRNPGPATISIFRAMGWS